ncbi:hypothetical protein KCU62_g226, partial [Aureobasidium sp. EXF-3399]
MHMHETSSTTVCSTKLARHLCHLLTLKCVNALQSGSLRDKSRTNETMAVPRTTPRGARRSHSLFHLQVCPDPKSMADVWFDVNEQGIDVATFYLHLLSWSNLSYLAIRVGGYQRGPGLPNNHRITQIQPADEGINKVNDIGSGQKRYRR